MSLTKKQIKTCKRIKNVLECMILCMKNNDLETMELLHTIPPKLMETL